MNIDFGFYENWSIREIDEITSQSIESSYFFHFFYFVKQENTNDVCTFIL